MITECHFSLLGKGEDSRLMVLLSLLQCFILLYDLFELCLDQLVNFLGDLILHNLLETIDLVV